jgi:hypothetical protein
MAKEQIIQLMAEAGLKTPARGDFIFIHWDQIALLLAHERNKLAAWMIQFGFATGHGDTMEQLCDALGTEIVDRIDGEVEAEREACAKVCEELQAPDVYNTDDKCMWDISTMDCAEAIRARGNT